MLSRSRHILLTDGQNDSNKRRTLLNNFAHDDMTPSSPKNFRILRRYSLVNRADLHFRNQRRPAPWISLFSFPIKFHCGQFLRLRCWNGVGLAMVGLRVWLGPTRRPSLHRRRPIHAHLPPLQRLSRRCAPLPDVASWDQNTFRCPSRAKCGRQKNAFRVQEISTRK